MFTQLKIGLIALGILLGFTPAHVSNTPSFGATIATTSLSDTLGTFRTNVNTSLENLNTQLTTVSSTVSGFGTIVAYNSPLPVANGGTSLSSGPTGSTQFLGANGTTPEWKSLVGVGITVSTTTTSTILTSQNIDTSQNFNWTGGHTFAGGVTSTATALFTATTTFSGNTIFSTTPTVATTTVSSDLQVVSKGYVDLFGSTATSTSLSSSATGNQTTSSTQAFSLSQAGSVIYVVDGSASGVCGSTGNCTVTIDIDGANSTAKTFSQTTVAFPAMFFYKTGSLSAGNHIIKLTTTSGNSSNNVSYSGTAWIYTNK